MTEEVYEPREDSLLLAEQVKKYAFGKVLDVGTGSGIQAETALKSKKVKEVLAIDINPEAVKTVKKKGIKAKQSDLFSNVKGKFDTIVFNPPYLPQELKKRDITLEGGKKGYETIEKFMSQVRDFLKPNGIVLLLFSSLTKKNKVEEIIQHYGFEFEELSKQRIFFEELYVYLIRKSEILRILEKNKIKSIQRLTKGHRGLIYTGKLNSKKVTLKVQRKDIAARGTVNREAKFLKVLNKHKIGPKLLSSGEDYFIYEYVPGAFIPEFMEKSTKKEIIRILKNVFDQCYKMDKLGINKEEMHHPYKHVVVGKKPVLLDFERASYTEKPHNVTQFCQYVTSGKVTKILNKKSIKINKKDMRELAKKYKKELSKQDFEDIKKEVR